MARRERGTGGFRTRPNGLIEHRMSFGYDTQGRRIVVAVYGRTKRDCIAKMMAKRDEIARAGGVPVADQTTVGGWCAEWVKRQRTRLMAGEIEPRTLDEYERAIRLHVAPRPIARVRLDRLAVRDVDAWLDGMARDRVGGRARQYARMVLGAAVQRAVDVEMIDRNPVRSTPGPVHKTQEFPVWDVEEAQRFIEACQGDRYGALWTLAITSGARPHEMLGLRVEDVDLDGPEPSLKIEAQLVRYGQTRKRLKTAASRRRVLLPPIAVKALRKHRERMLAEGLRASPWLFPATDGRASHWRNVVTRSYDVIVAAAGVPRIRPYDLKHTYTTLAALAGVPLHVVSRALGHASEATTARHYARVVRSLERQHVEAVQRIFSATG